MPAPCPFPRMMPPLATRPGCHLPMQWGALSPPCRAWPSSWHVTPRGCCEGLRTGTDGEKVQQKPPSSLGGAPITLTKAVRLSPSCKSNKLLVFLTRRTGDRRGLLRRPPWRPLCPSPQSTWPSSTLQVQSSTEGVTVPLLPSPRGLGVRGCVKQGS